MPPEKHRKTIRHFHEPGHLHEFTFSCYQRRPLLLEGNRPAELARCLQAACRECHMLLVAFVFMPEHVHLLVMPQDQDPDLGLFLARVKQPFSKVAKAEIALQDPSLLGQLTIQERPGKLCFRFWQEGAGFDRNLFSKPAILASLDYIHSNPVKRGLCERAIDWKWSSARYYLAEPPRQQKQICRTWTACRGERSIDVRRDGQSRWHGGTPSNVELC